MICVAGSSAGPGSPDSSTPPSPRPTRSSPPTAPVSLGRSGGCGPPSPANGDKIIVARTDAGTAAWFLATVNRVAEVLAADGDTDDADLRSKSIGWGWPSPPGCSTCSPTTTTTPPMTIIKTLILTRMIKESVRMTTPVLDAGAAGSQ
jgi:hypothetical protein